MRVKLKENKENVTFISDEGSIKFVYDLLCAYGKPKISVNVIIY